MTTESGTAGRVVRTALIIFPLGLVLLGAGSFIFYFNHREQTEQRAIKYAAGLRKELNEADLKRYQDIFLDVLAKPADERNKTLATFLESTLGPENMGYSARSVMKKTEPDAPAVAIDAEVTGARKPRDLVLVVTSFLPDLTTIDNASVARPAAVFLNLAHSLTGDAKARTIRFVTVQNLEALKVYYDQDISAEERISHVLLLGPLAGTTDAQVTEALHLQGRGAVVLRPAIASGGDAASLMPSAQALRKQVIELAERL